jgi:hypothetical protein
MNRAVMDVAAHESIRVGLANIKNEQCDLFPLKQSVEQCTLL